MSSHQQIDDVVFLPGAKKQVYMHNQGNSNDITDTENMTMTMADSIPCFTRSDFGEGPFRLYANYL